MYIICLHACTYYTMYISIYINIFIYIYFIYDNDNNNIFIHTKGQKYMQANKKSLKTVFNSLIPN